MKVVIGFFTASAVALLSGCTTPDRSSTYGTSGGYSSAQGRQVVSSSPSSTSGYSYGGSQTYSGAPSTYPSQGAAAAQHGNSSTQEQSEADRSLVSQIRNQLDQYGTLAQVAPNLNVDSRFGTVTLRGAVPTEREKQMIVALVRTTPGVVSVNDQLTVAGGSSPTGSGSTRIYSSDQNNTSGSSSGSATTISTPAAGDMFSLHVQGLNDTDRQVAQRIISGLRSDSTLGQLVPRVNIDVANGKVTLRGTVQNDQQRQTIASAVQRATGSAIDDELQVAQPGSQP